jgi:PAS domain S-box-containing protein
MNKFEACRNGNPQTFEWSGQKLDGTRIETEVTLSSLMHNGRLCTQSIIRDITPRKELEATLRDSEVRFRVLYENAGDAIAIMEDGQIIDCNKRTLEIYGIPRDEVLSTSTTEFFPPIQPNGRNSRELFQEMVMASRSGEPQHFEWHGRNRAGTAVITEVSLTTFTLGDKIYEQSISRDITQRKQMEAALVELNRTLEKRVAKRTEELETACAELLQRNFQ